MNSNVLITGATGGIGYEFVKLFAAKNFHIIAVGRNQEELDKLYSEFGGNIDSEIVCMKADLSDKMQVYDLLNYIKGSGREIDVLVNNAASAVFGEFICSDIEEEIASINTNILAFTIITKAILKDMVRRGSGRVLNVASTAAFKPGPLMAVYYATKSYMLSFSIAVASEIKDSGVSITVLCPGPTKTKFLEKSSPVELVNIDYSKMADPAEVALAGYSSLVKGKQLEIPGLKNKFNAIVAKLMPTSLLTDLLYRRRKKSIN